MYSCVMHAYALVLRGSPDRMSRWCTHRMTTGSRLSTAQQLKVLSRARGLVGERAFWCVPNNLISCPRTCRGKHCSRYHACTIDAYVFAFMRVPQTHTTRTTRMVCSCAYACSAIYLCRLTVDRVMRVHAFVLLRSCGHLNYRCASGFVRYTAIRYSTIGISPQ